MINFSIDRVDRLARFAATHGRFEGLSDTLMAAHMLLACVGVGGDRLVWRPLESRTPRFGRASVTFLGRDDDRPTWFMRQLKPIVEEHEQARRFAWSQVLQQPTAAEIRERRKHVERLKQALPEAAQTIETSGPTFSYSEFLVGIRNRVPKPEVQDKAFGRDRMVLLFRDPAYEALNRSSGHGHLYREAALNSGAGLRATLHGWVCRKRFRWMVRRLPIRECAIYGWLISADRSGLPDPLSSFAKSCDGVYTNPLSLRFLRPMSVYQPPADVSAMLDRADHEWELPMWCESEPLRDLLRLDEELAWQLATALRMIGIDSLHEEDDLRRQVDFAAQLAQWIRAVHCREVRLLFPGPLEDPAERLSCDVVDRLRQQPCSVRDLCRAIRGAKADQVRHALRRMEKEGWMKEGGGGRWSTNFPPLPDPSGLLSTFLSKTGEEAPSAAGG